MENMMFSFVEVEQIILLLQQRNQKIDTNRKINKKPKVSENFNGKNYTKWCKEMEIELGDREMLNHITAIPPTTITPQWKQYDSRVMSWILACINSDIIDLGISFTTTANELWTGIHTLYGPILLPPVNGTIKREVARGSNIEEVSTQVNGERGSKEIDKNQIPKEEGTN